MAALSFLQPMLLSLIHDAAGQIGIEADDPAHERDLAALAASLHPAVDMTLNAIVTAAPTTEVSSDADLRQHILTISATAIPDAAAELGALPSQTRQAVLRTFVDALSSRQPPRQAGAWLRSVAKRASHEALRALNRPGFRGGCTGRRKAHQESCQ